MVLYGVLLAFRSESEVLLFLLDGIDIERSHRLELHLESPVVHPDVEAAISTGEDNDLQP